MWAILWRTFKTERDSFSAENWNVLIAEALGITNPDYYYYLNQSGCITVAGVDDAKDFQETLVSDTAILIPAFSSLDH